MLLYTAHLLVCSKCSDSGERREEQGNGATENIERRKRGKMKNGG